MRERQPQIRKTYHSADARVKKLLENDALILDGLEPSVAYDRLHDDTDGEDRGRVMVQMSSNGDMHLTTDVGPYKNLRFRNWAGGGASPRVHNALKILALAIKLDNKDKPLR